MWQKRFYIHGGPPVTEYCKQSLLPQMPKWQVLPHNFFGLLSIVYGWEYFMRPIASTQPIVASLPKLIAHSVSSKRHQQQCLAPSPTNVLCKLVINLHFRRTTPSHSTFNSFGLSNGLFYRLSTMVFLLHSYANPNVSKIFFWFPSVIKK
jgi:hypothetical protein